MRTTLNSKTFSLTIGTGFAAVALASAGPAFAQDDAMAQDVDTATPAQAPMTDEQMAQIADWPAERQTAYEMWPAETKSYYWTLLPERQELFWRLADDDKIALTAMTGPERDNAWSSIEGAATTPPPEG